MRKVRNQVLEENHFLKLRIYYLFLYKIVEKSVRNILWNDLYGLAATVVVSGVQLHRVSQESHRIQQWGWAGLFHSFGMFIITFLAMLLLIQQKVSMEANYFLPNCMQGLKNNRMRLIKWLVRFLCVILNSRRCRLLSWIFVFAVLSSNDNCNFWPSAACIELIHAAILRNSPVPLEGLHPIVEIRTSVPECCTD